MSPEKHEIKYTANGFAELSDGRIIHESGDFELRSGVGRAVLYDSGLLIPQKKLPKRKLT